MTSHKFTLDLPEPHYVDPLRGEVTPVEMNDVYEFDGIIQNIKGQIQGSSNTNTPKKGIFPFFFESLLTN